VGVCHHSGFYEAWGRLIEASAPIIRLDATQSGPLMPPPLSSPNFMPDSLPAATLPIYPDLGQAPNMLDCIPVGLAGPTATKKLIVIYLGSDPDH